MNSIEFMTSVRDQIWAHHREMVAHTSIQDPGWIKIKDQALTGLRDEVENRVNRQACNHILVQLWSELLR